MNDIGNHLEASGYEGWPDLQERDPWEDIPWEDEDDS